MPAALQVDLGLIQAFYMQGASSPQIAAKFGVNLSTVQGWVHRYGWNKARQVASGLIQAQSKSVRMTAPVLSKTVSGTSERVRESLASELEKQVTRLSEIPIKPGLAGLARKASVTKLLVDASRPVLGWDEQRMSGAVSVESMLDLSPITSQVTVAPAIESDMASIPNAQPSESTDCIDPGI
jgi:hypothetical protein